ncbi:MAG: adenylyltransferase/cytidyltransferase family protein [Pseudomonadota bacterium]|nr:adenylyltransferase/cytidyltransferase family protein [Pseudomonadota bacterium]
MTTVITYGTFDLFHVGHVNLLRRLRDLGDRLVVGLSTDEFNAEKGKTSVMPYKHRAEIVGSVRYVDHVFPESTWGQKRDDITREGARIFAMGDDWVGKFDDLGDICEVVYLPRTRDVSSTEIRQLLHGMQQDRVHELRRAAEHVLQLVSAL